MSQDETEKLADVLNREAQDHPVSPKMWVDLLLAGGVSVYTSVGFDWVKAHGQMVITVHLLVALGAEVERRRILCLLRDQDDRFLGIGRFDSGEVEFRVPAGTYHLEFYCRPRTSVAA